MNKYFIILFSIFLFTGCKIRFRDEDLTSYNVYKVNDTLAFKDKDGLILKYQIISRSIINKGWDENTGWYNPQVAYVKYESLTDGDSAKYSNAFLTIYQRTGNDIEETIYFKGFLGDIHRKVQQTNEYATPNTGAVYKVAKFDMSTVRDPADIAYVYWSDNVGIVAYDYKNGDRWVLIK